VWQLWFCVDVDSNTGSVKWNSRAAADIGGACLPADLTRVHFGSHFL
jgi:hypothetical protein